MWFPYIKHQCNYYPPCTQPSKLKTIKWNVLINTVFLYRTIILLSQTLCSIGPSELVFCSHNNGCSKASSRRKEILMAPNSMNQTEFTGTSVSEWHTSLTFLLQNFLYLLGSPFSHDPLGELGTLKHLCTVSIFSEIQEWATHSTIFTWKITWMEELADYSPWGPQGVRHDHIEHTWLKCRQLARLPVLRKYLLKMRLNHLPWFPNLCTVTTLGSLWTFQILGCSANQLSHNLRDEPKSLVFLKAF